MNDPVRFKEDVFIGGGVAILPIWAQILEGWVGLVATVLGLILVSVRLFDRYRAGKRGVDLSVLPPEPAPEDDED